MSQNFPTPPTFASPVVVNPSTGQNQFNPIWLQWFLVLASFLEGSTVGRLKDFIPVASSGSYTPSSGVNNVLVMGWGSGGPGGNAAVTTASQVSVGGGGGAGAFGMYLYSSGFSGVSFVIGTAGAATVFHGPSLLTCGGGTAGATSTLSAAPAVALGGAGGVTSGGIMASQGGRGDNGIVLSSSIALSGAGANSGLGGGGPSVTVQGPGTAGVGFASGGSGALNFASSASPQNGGLGAPGFGLIMELS